MVARPPAEAEAAIAEADVVIAHNGKIEARHRRLLDGKPVVSHRPQLSLERGRKASWTRACRASSSASIRRRFRRSPGGPECPIRCRCGRLRLRRTEGQHDHHCVHTLGTTRKFPEVAIA